VSRSGYTTYGDGGWQLIMWRGAVASAIRGKRGQRLIDDMQAALDAMPVKELHAEVLQEVTGPVCAIGAVARARGIDLTTVNPELPEVVSERLDIAEALAKEIAYENDEGGPGWVLGIYREETPADRWLRMREWAWDKSNTPRPSMDIANHLAAQASAHLCQAADMFEVGFEYRSEHARGNARQKWRRAFRMAGVDIPEKAPREAG